MLRQLMGLSLVVVSFVAHGAVDKKTTSEYWADVDLDYGVFVALASPNRCNSKLEVYLGCIHGVNAILAAAGEKTQLATLAEIKDNPRLVASVEKFGALDLVQFEPLPKEKSLIASVKRQKIEQKAGYEFLKTLYESPTGKINFVPIYQYVLDKVMKSVKNEAEVTAAGINLFLNTADDAHTRIIPSQQLDDEQSATPQSFVGIGVQIRQVEGELVVIQPVEGGPAHQAGVRARDVITHIDGQDLKGLSLEDSMKRIKGEKGSQVKLTVRRTAGAVELTVTRDHIVTKNVTYKMLGETRKKVGYLKLSDFMQGDPAADLKKGVAELKEKGAEAFVFDLRGNGGGRIDHAVTVANVFVGRDLDVVSQKALKTKEVLRVHKTTEEAATTLPLVTLVDAGSASAAEIVSGALQDHKRGLIVGQRSFGKGSVQGVQQFPIDGIYILRTMATFHLPSGRSNQILGVVPDIEAYSNPNPTEEDKFALREEDIYMNALPVSSEKFQPLQPELIASVTQCVDRTGEARRRFTTGQENTFAPDYAVLVAQDVLSCQ